jgi:hypothetical protein
MLQTSYPSQDKIPEDKRGAYVERDGKWILDDLSQDHPVIVHKTKLETDLSAEKGKVTRLTNEKSQLEANVIPTGQKAVPEADAALVEEVKALGKSGKELKIIVAEHVTLTKEKQERQTDEVLDRAAKDLGYENQLAFRAAAKALGVEVTFKEETVDGKKVERPYVGDKSLADHVDATPALKALEPAFKTRPSATPPSTEAGAGSRPAPEGGPGGGPGAGGGGDRGGGNGNGGGGEQTYRFQEAGDVKW